MQEAIISQLIQDHNRLFGSVGVRKFFAGGRVNLIGEHLDYNGGYVLPCSLNIGTYATVSGRSDNKFRLYSSNFVASGVIEFDLSKLVNDKSHGWANYVKGVIKGFVDHGFKLKHGLDICISGDLPHGAGLSSSASIEVLISIILNEIFELKVDRVMMAKIAQSSENNFIGVSCGIMDQFASILGKLDHALLLNCQNLDYKSIPLDLAGYKIVIANTNKKRTLADSKYNERCFECAGALNDLKTKLSINYLCDLSLNELNNNIGLITNEIWQKRALHVVSENERTIRAVDMLIKNDLISFGDLLNQSHLSLKNDYEVTGFELDTMVSLALEHKSCIGSRMTGAGFGGCTISIVEDSGVKDFIDTLTNQYHQLTNLQPQLYVAQTGNQAMELV